MAYVFFINISYSNYKLFSVVQTDLEKANEIHLRGKALIEDDHYAVDSISPKCLELEKMVGDFQHQLQRKLDILRKYCDLHEKIEKVFPYYCLTFNTFQFNF